MQTDSSSQPLLEIISISQCSSNSIMFRLRNLHLQINNSREHFRRLVAIAPGKRPLSSMSPSLVFRRDFDGEVTEDNDLGKLFMTLGSSGGPKIITAVLQVLLITPYSACRATPQQQILAFMINCCITTVSLPPTINVHCSGPTIEVTNRTMTALKKRKQNSFSRSIILERPKRSLLIWRLISSLL